VRKRTIVVAGIASLFAAGVACASVGSNEDDAGVDAAAEISTPPPDREASTEASSVCAIVDAGHGDGAPPAGLTRCGADEFDLSLSPKNCGACGRECPSSTCAGGRCPVETITVASNTPSASVLGGGGSIVVYRAQRGGSVAALRIDPNVDASETDLYETDSGYPYAAALATNAIYVAASDGIRSFPLPTGIPVIRGAPTIFAAISVARDTLYLLAAKNVLRLENDGGTFPIASVGTPGDTMAADTDALYWVDTEAGLAAAVRYDLAASAIRKVPISGARAIAVDDDFAYVYTAEGAIVRVGKSFTDPKPEAVASIYLRVGGDPVRYVAAMLVDETFLYIALRPAQVEHVTWVYRVPKCGGDPLLLSQTDGDTAIGLSGAYVILANGTDVVRVAK
jgi:hypothetical protein